MTAASHHRDGARVTSPPASITRRSLHWLPSWTQTIRFRLTVVYSAVLFGVAAVLVLGVYLTLTNYLDAQPLDAVEMPSGAFKDDVGVWHVPDGGATFQVAEIESVEKAANYKTLGMLRELSLEAIAVLFLASLALGWLLAGRVLRPIQRITRTADEISATDLSRRIDLSGPDDELRQLADTLDGMLARLEQAFSEQRQIVGDASHELRNPLAVIRANIDAVLAHDDISPDARAQSAAVVLRATSRMTRLIEDLLASARRSSPAFVDSDVDLATVAGEVADEYDRLAESRGLRVLRSIDDRPVAAGDPRALARAVDNLLSNAVRLAPVSSVIVVATGATDGWAWISVTDEGPGIAPADQQRIFNRFYRGTSVLSAHTESNSGLGLAIVRQIVEGHDGVVAVDSDFGRGSTFTLWLPDRSSPDSQRSASPPALTTRARPTPAGRGERPLA